MQNKSEDKRYGSIDLTSDGFAVHNKRGVMVVRLILNDVLGIVTFKRDLWVEDLICFEFHTAAGNFEVNEDMEGFSKLTQQLEQKLPAFDRKWYEKVVQPPFAKNVTTIYRKNA